MAEGFLAKVISSIHKAISPNCLPQILTIFYFQFFKTLLNVSMVLALALDFRAFVDGPPCFSGKYQMSRVMYEILY